MCQQSQILLGGLFRNSPKPVTGGLTNFFIAILCVIQRDCVIHALLKERHFALTLHMW